MIENHNNSDIYLDDLKPVQVRVGYGQLGIHGSLGYEGKSVRVQNRSFAYVLSTHPPAQVDFYLGGRFRSFNVEVAINDDVKTNVTSADFEVRADGREVAAARHIMAGGTPKSLIADITGAQFLQLIVKTTRWEFCHALWLNARVSLSPVSINPQSLIDCLHRTKIELPSALPKAPRCIATTAGYGYAALLDDLLGSLCANGECHDAVLVVFVLDDDPDCRRIATKYNAIVIKCKPIVKVNSGIKALLYSVARVINAEEFICLDADMIIIGELRSIFSAIKVCPNNNIFACREGNGYGFHNLEHVLTTAYCGKSSDFIRILGNSNGEGTYPLVVNDGLFAGSRAALLLLDHTIRAMPQAAVWVDERHDITYRNQFIFNLALARMNCGIELKPTYNIQLHVQDVDIQRSGAKIKALWNGEEAYVLHFNGWGRSKYTNIRNMYAQVSDPLIYSSCWNGYDDFKIALRSWIGLYGLKALTWSFYGQADGNGAWVNDPSTMPLLALLHYLIRANGCVKVLETGTARGISAACLASAVCHRKDGKVVTFDPTPLTESVELWATLPKNMGECIEQRSVDSLKGMAAAFAAGEHYEAALLDSLHYADHVLKEFQLATQLVCKGGLILIHDVNFIHGTVAEALQQIKKAGYSITRLWTAEAGVRDKKFHRKFRQFRNFYLGAPMSRLSILATDGIFQNSVSSV